MRLAAVTPIAAPDPDLIESLEHLLEDVRSGHVSSVLAVWGTASGGMTGRLRHLGDSDSVLQLIGEAAMLYQSLVDDLKAHRDET